jgi:hypothetical protein
LENREQRIVIWHSELSKSFSNRAILKSGKPHSSILGPMSVLFYINDLPQGININSNLLLYADDTSVLMAGTSICVVRTKSIIALDNIKKKLFMRNGLSLKLK